MTKSTSKAAVEKDLAYWEAITSAPGFDEEAFEREHFLPIDEAVAQGLVSVCDGKGNWRKVEPHIRVTLNLSPAIRRRAESLDAFLSMGYQNVLKTAMLLGIKELEAKVG
jgi:hypothetical protein